jgi:hypothetical protein
VTSLEQICGLQPPGRDCVIRCRRISRQSMMFAQCVGVNCVSSV